MNKRIYKWLLPIALSLLTVPLVQNLIARRDYDAVMSRERSFHYLPYIAPVRGADHDAWARSEGLRNRGGREAYRDIVLQRMPRAEIRTSGYGKYLWYRGTVRDPIFNEDTKLEFKIDPWRLPDGSPVDPNEEVGAWLLPDINGDGAAGDAGNLSPFYRHLNRFIQTEAEKMYEKYRKKGTEADPEMEHRLI